SKAKTSLLRRLPFTVNQRSRSRDRFGHFIRHHRLLLSRALGLVGERLHAVVARDAGPRRDQATHDDVFLQADQAIDLAVDGGFGEHLGGLLKRRRRDEALGREARLRDAKEERLRDSRLSALREDALVLLVEAP